MLRKVNPLASSGKKLPVKSRYPESFRFLVPLDVLENMQFQYLLIQPIDFIYPLLIGYKQGLSEELRSLTLTITTVQILLPAVYIIRTDKLKWMSD